MFINKPAFFVAQEGGNNFRVFAKEFAEVVRNPPYRRGERDIREAYVRDWECWAIMNNLHLVHGMKPEHKLLEYGAHPLFHCIYFQKKFDCEVWAIDNFQVRERVRGGVDVFNTNYFPEEWLEEIAKYKLERLHAEEGDITHTRFQDKFFDTIISIGVHEHVEDDLQGMKEVHRILKDDGYVSMTVDFQYHPLPYDKITQGRCYNQESLTNLINQSGFEHVFVPNWEIAELWKDIPNTWEKPIIFAIAVILKKKGV